MMKHTHIFFSRPCNAFSNVFFVRSDKQILGKCEFRGALRIITNVLYIQHEKGKQVTKIKL